LEDVFQEYIIELYKHPLNFGEIKDADYSADAYNASCGDRVQLYLKVKDGKINEARHSGSGCAISQATASLLTEYLKGKNIENVRKIGKEEVLKLIRVDLSKNPTRMKCALMSLEALRKAVNQK
jgi:nitrogen fixation NifU-like protein